MKNFKQSRRLYNDLNKPRLYRLSLRIDNDGNYPNDDDDDCADHALIMPKMTDLKDAWIDWR